MAFGSGLGCTVGQAAPGSVANLVACAGGLASRGTTQGPFVYDLSASGSGSSTALSLTWKSAPYTGPQSYPCTAGAPFAMDRYVVEGAPLFSDYGYTYISDDKSMAKYTPGGAGGTGTCAWGRVNPAGAAMISWNAVYLPPSGSFGGSYYLVGQGAAGPVLLVGYLDALTKVQLPLPDGGGGSYVTYNTIAAVETATGARVYDSTADCPTNGGCNPYAQAPGRLYAIDITSPSTANGTPTMSVAWHYDFEGPAGASPMVLPAASGAPAGDQIYFDGSPCATPCVQPHPTLFALRDQGGGSYATLFAEDFTAQFGVSEDGYCPLPGGGTVYRGIQAAAALENPEATGADLNYSVWAFVTCGPTLYRFDAQTGALWTGSGASTINVGALPGLANYVPSSTMNTVTDATTGHTTMFVGAGQAPASMNSYVLALDLETGSLFWKVLGPLALQADDTPFNGQFPIAQTAGGNVLIATTAGTVDGSSILAIPLS